MPYMVIVVAALESAGTHSEKGNAVPVLRIHVCMYLENKAGKFVLFR